MWHATGDNNALIYLSKNLVLLYNIKILIIFAQVEA